MKIRNTAISLLCIGNLLGISFAQKSSLLWRKDGRCGNKFPLPNGSPGQCDPEGDGPKKGPCCSPKGFCGNTVKHCKCPTCIDYSNSTVKLREEQVDKKEGNEEVTPSPVIQTRSGAIRGKKVASKGKSTYFEFLAIPYAQPPVGRLRFKPPKMVRPWTKTFEAMKRGPQCYQKSEALGTNVSMSEDCLQLNIYTPDLEKTSKPVMIWIHGGGFVIGSANDYNPERLTREGVIVVTINYRLGSLGFLTFGNDLVSGNMGLKDQALAIQWVKQNIEQFGVYAAKTFDCSDDKVELDEATLQCLQDVDVKQLNEKLSRTDKEDFANFSEAFPFEWRPVIDNYASNPFLPLHPLEAMITGIFNRIPFISGTVKNEGALMVGGMKAQGITNEKIKENWASIGAPLLLTSSTEKNFTFASKIL